MDTANYDMYLNEGWKFHLGELERLTEIPIGISHHCCKAGGALREWDFWKEDAVWKNVILPHDWQTELPLQEKENAAGGFKQRGTGWYYLKFELPKTGIEHADLIFDGVLGNSAVYVNGVIAGRNFSGYNRFSMEIGDYLLPGAENELAVYVDARKIEGWWYEGAGIYRPVHIAFRPYMRFDAEKCFVRCEKQNEKWLVAAELCVSEVDAAGDKVVVTATLQDHNGCTVAVAEALAESLTEIRLPVPEPKLWSPEEPYLYTLLCELKKDGIVTERFFKKTGLRTIEWIANKGMFLNGKHYPVKGICCHQDHAGVGAAVPKELMEYRIVSLKKLGVNAYRCAHHAPSEELLDICDRLGMLVMVENRHFAVSEDVLKQVDALVYLSRNHTSVFLYSLFNEEPWQKEERGKRIAEKLRQRIRALDATRAITGAQNGGTLAKSNASDVLDVIGVNYFLADYDATHERTPDKVMIGTENCPTYATRGVYTSDPEKQIFANYGEEWGRFSESLEETMETVFAKPYAAGCFAWCGFDHRGEPTPYGWPSVISHWGFQDECGFPKDTAYLLAAWYREDLCVHVMPHWNWKPGENVRVCAFTNGDTAELFLNGRSLGVRNVERKRAEWSVSYEPGELRVCAVKDGKEVWDKVQTAEEAAVLKIEDVGKAPDSRIRILNISATDKKGVLVPDCADEITIEVPEGSILGVGNGDPNSHHDQKSETISLFHGRAQVILKGGAENFTLHCKGLSEVHTRIYHAFHVMESK